VNAIVIAVALNLATPAAPLAALAPPEAEIEALYREGQAHYQQRHYAAAAEAWTRLLDLLPESEDNREIRESVILNVLDARLEAYALVLDDGRKPNVEHLRAAKATLDDYYLSFRRVHGDRVAVSAPVQERAEAIDRALAEAEPPPPVPVPPIVKPPDPIPISEPPPRDGNGLIIGGSILAAAGLATVAMIPVGSVQGQRALAIYEDPMWSPEQRTAAQGNGQRANAILIAGAVLSPLLVAAGATMIGLGVRKKRRALTPTVGRGSAGLVLSGRF
jgi:hypothetical protein